MLFPQNRQRLRVVGFLAAVFLLTSASVHGQNNNNGGNNGANNTNTGGILINSKGVLAPSPVIRRSESLSEKRLLSAAGKNLPQELNQPAELRVVSLIALEKECARLREANESLPDEILYLAGLQQISHVLFDEQNKDILIGGPADGFARNALKVMVGVHSQRPVLLLHDLLVALRSRSDTIGCSIDPDQQRLAQVNRFLQTAGPASSIAAAKSRYRHLAKMLGNQNVTIWGVPKDSHFARVMVEADFRLKRIAVGQEKPHIKGISSYLQTDGAGTNSLRRWWFAAAYDAILHTANRSVWNLGGHRVQLLSQDEIVSNNGGRRDVGEQKKSTVEFAENFTTHYSELAEKSTIFAQLQNLFDLGIAVEIIRRENMSRRAEWDMSEFLSAENMPVEEFKVPKFAPSASASKQISRDIVIGVVSGGVRFAPGKTLARGPFRVDPELETIFRKTQERIAEAKQGGKQIWWWDVLDQEE